MHIVFNYFDVELSFSMSSLHTFNSEIHVKFPIYSDNISEVEQLDMFDSKLTVWEDYVVGIQLLVTGKNDSIKRVQVDACNIL
jgi:hypothetical protein